MRERIVALVAHADPPPQVVVLEVDQDDVDVESLDVLAELAIALRRDGVELRLGGVRPSVRELVERAGLTAAVPVAGTLDEATHARRSHST